MKRVVWEYVHKGSGYTAVVLAVITIFIDVTLPAPGKVQLAFCIVFFMMLVCLLSLIGSLCLDGRKAAEASEKKNRADTDTNHNKLAPL